jgi:hypothetical protein
MLVANANSILPTVIAISFSFRQRYLLGTLIVYFYILYMQNMIYIMQNMIYKQIGHFMHQVSSIISLQIKTWKAYIVIVKS